MTERVSELRYSVTTASGHKFVDTTFHVQLGDFDCVLAEGRLTARPRVDFAEWEEARAALEPYLEGWSSKAEIVDGMPMNFRIAASYTTETDGVEDEIHLGENLVEWLYRDNSEYPLPDARWREESSLAFNLRIRWRREGWQYISLPVTARRMIAAIEREYGDDGEISAQLHVSREVIDELRRLVPADDQRSARMFHESLTRREHVWLDNALAALVRRVHEVDAGIDDLSELTKKGLK